MSEHGLARLMEVIESLRKETVKKLDELESRVDERTTKSKRELAEMVDLIFALSNAIAMTYYLELLAELKRGSPKVIEQGLRELLGAWRDVIYSIKEVFGLVDWSMIQERSKPLLRVAKRNGLPFRVVAARVVEVMGPDAKKFLKEDAIAEVYGLVSLHEWRRATGSR